MTAIVVFLTAIAALISVIIPWAGVLIYYLLGVSQPQGYWPWIFDTSRSSLIITLATFLGLIIAIAMRKVDLRVFFSKQNVLILLIVIWINFANANSIFNNSNEIEKIGVFANDWILSNFNKIAFFYFVAVLLIDTKEKLLMLFYVFAAVILAYTAWANKVYLTGEFWLFGDNGRLGGPYTSMYYDENYLGMLFVLGTPVLYYLGAASNYRVIRYGLWLSVPLCWHALFLTGTRGGLVALCIVCFYLFLRSYNKLTSIGVVLGLILAVVFQSGFLLQRVDNTVEAADELAEEALDPRLISWQAGYDMIKDYPMYGVGMGNFINAFPRYSETQPHVAHNTFLQLAADSGVITGLIYLYIWYSQLIRFFTKRREHKSGREGIEENYIDDMITAMFVGFFVVAMFLDLLLYEVFWFLLVVSYCKRRLDNPFRISIFRIENESSIYTQSSGSSIYTGNDLELKKGEQEPAR